MQDQDKNEGNGKSSEREERLVPDGRYKVKCYDHAYSTAGEKKTPQIVCAIEIVEGDYKGQRLQWYGFITPDAEERTVQGMFALGWDGLDDATLYTGVAEAVIEVETYNNKKRSKVQWINPIGVVVKTRMEGAELVNMKNHMKGIATRMRGSNGNGGAQSLPPPPARRNAGPSAPPQDDIPFPTDDDQPTRYRR